MLTGRRRNNLVLVQSRSLASGQWNDAETWSEYGQFWVSIDPQRGREQFSAGELESVVTHTIRGDYMELKDMTPDMRVIFQEDMVYSDGASTPVYSISASARVFNILAVMPDHEQHADVMLKVEEEQRRYGKL